MRFCFAVAPLRGHVNPTMGVARELASRGHEVDFYLPASHPDAKPSGVTVRHYFQTPPTLPADPALRFAEMPLAATRDAVEVLPQVLPRLERHPPDVMVYDALCVWGRLATTVLPSARVMLCTTYAHCDSWSMHASPQFAAVRPGGPAIARYGQDMTAMASTHGTQALELHELLLHQEQRTIVFMPRSFQPQQGSFDNRWSFVGPVVAPHSGSADHATPTVYVSLGTLFDDWPGLFPLCEEAFSAGSWRVIVSTRQCPEGSRGPLEIRHDVAQVPTLQASDVFVTHGGMNGTMEAVLTGTPMLVLPQIAEQRLTAARVAELGLGLQMDPQRVTPARLRVAVESLRDNATIHSALARMRSDALAAGGAKAAADACEAAI